MEQDALLRSFRFQIKLRKSAAVEAGSPPPEKAPAGDPLADGAFQECTGLDIEMDVQEYQEGGRNDGVIRRVGRGKYSNIVLKRGMFYRGSGGLDSSLWKWLQSVLAGDRPVARYDGIVQVMGKTDDVVATWTFNRGLPAKIVGPQLNAKTGEVAIEELHIAHEGLRLEVS